MASAQTLINGIYYNLDIESKQATVTYRSFGGYAGNVNIPESVTYNGVNYVVTSIEAGAFYDCVDLTSVTIPSNVTEIGNSAFEGCSGLTSLEIPNGVTFIGTDAFTGTAWLDNQPEGLLYIGKVVYKYIGTMPENTSISLKEGTTAIVGKAFHECSGLISIDIPNTVTSIGMGAFTYCSNLTSVIIPQGVTSIGTSAFNSCYSLASVSIPNSVTSIGSGSFYKCKALTEIVIPNSVIEIGYNAFQNCSNLTSVIIGNSVTLLNNSAFSGCSRLTDVYCYVENVPSTGSNVFTESTIRSTTLYVPALALENYKNSEPWSGFGNIVALDDEQVVEDVAINETNFPDENFRNWILERYGSDGVLTDDEIASADKISFPDIRVQSLKGIEYFTALGTLYFCDSPITTLDVSKNTELTYLGCPNCQLTSLDVSKNTKLTSLYCNGNNLTSLDVSQNTALKNLAIYNNQIKGAEMDTLVESLPTVSSGTLYAIYNTDEQNEMTTTQVAAALAKGWTPKYMVNGRWQDYAGSEPEVMKCATPVVAFYDGKLVFMCETEDVEYKYQIATPLMSESDGTNVSMPTKIQLIIYATKDGYEPSDTVTKEIDLKALIGQLGDVNGDGEIGMADIMYMVQYILNGKFPDEE